jgi:hypothetical protein
VCIATACQSNVEQLVGRFEEKLQSSAKVFEQSIQGSTGRTTGRTTRATTTTNAANAVVATTQGETWLIWTNTRGELSRLPDDFQFPKGGMYDCWVQWNVVHVDRSIPPLRTLTPREFQFIDAIAKLDSEKRGQRGPTQYKDKQRPSWKTYSNMKFLCNYIQKKAGEAGSDIRDRTLENVRKMFDHAVKELVVPGDRTNQRMDQFKWRTMVSRIRKMIKEQQQQGVG